MIADRRSENLSARLLLGKGRAQAGAVGARLEEQRRIATIRSCSAKSSSSCASAPKTRSPRRWRRLTACPTRGSARSRRSQGYRDPAQGVPRKAPGPAAVPRRGRADGRRPRAGQRLSARRDRAAVSGYSVQLVAATVARHQGHASDLSAQRQGLRHRRHHRRGEARRVHAHRDQGRGHRQPRSRPRAIRRSSSWSTTASTTR